MSGEIIEIVKSALSTPNILKEIYYDLAKPGVSQVGKAIETLLGLGNTILWPIALLNEKSRIALSTNLEKYRESLENTPIENIVKVLPEVGTPILEKISYVTNEELSNMYLRLLTRASIKVTVDKAHPSFVNIINNISPDEALLLKHYSTINAEPWIEVRRSNTKEGYFSIVDNMRTNLNKIEGLIFPSNISYYVENLEGLGILRVRRDIQEKDKEPYEKLEMEAYEKYKGWENEDTKITYQRGVIDVNAFGRLFMNTCVREH